IKQAVIAGMGVACLSKLAVAREVAAGLLSEINHHLNLQRRLQILLRQGSQETPLQQAMLAYLFRTEFLQE
ncbi:MAG TPA: LysR substrate-binding domain-containing protein, partial [Candidatus Rifleibacterium sp.]|nr:LysR substrate-binding domain-containing protein [Candidatus Rifleibacterium sp.]